MFASHPFKPSWLGSAPRLAVVALLWLVMSPLATYGQGIPDPGYPTTLRIMETSEIYLGQSTPVPVMLLNDEAIEAIWLKLVVNAPDTDFVSDPGDYATFDSITYWPMSMDDPEMLDYRTVVFTGNQSGDGSDTVVLMMRPSNPPHKPIPADLCHPFAVFWFTGVAPGYIMPDLDELAQTRLYPEGTPIGSDGYFLPTVIECPDRIVIEDTTTIPDPVDTAVCGDRNDPDGIAITEIGETYPIGESTPFSISLINDEPIRGCNGTVRLLLADSGSVSYDSIHFVGRLADPSITSLRFWGNGHGNVPDSVQIFLIDIGYVPIPVGGGPIFEVFVSGTSRGQVGVSASFRVGALCDDGSMGPGSSLDLVAESAYLTVGEAVSQAPVFEPMVNPAPFVTGGMVSFEVEASSPVGNPVEVTLESFYLYDSLYGESVSQPVFSSGVFNWTPDPADVGIWKATFVATDQVTGRTAEADVVIQVVSGSEYLLSCETIEKADALPASGIVHGDYDGDGAPEIMVSADGWVTGSLAVYDHLGFGQLQEGFTLSQDLPNRGLVTGYINEDNYLDAVTCMAGEVWVLLGDGSGGFTVQDANVPRPSGGTFIDAALADFNGDAYLDYICLSGSSVITIYAGGPDASFAQVHSFSADAPGLTLAAADLNGDGWDDLTVGTNLGLEVYLNDGLGTYELSYSYTQNLGTYDIDITDQGSDFNGDGIYDLCIAAPGTGPNEGLSDLEVHFGQGDGTYNSVSVKVLYGTVCSNRAGDFNGDGKLDIAFINSTERYLGLLFGDGTGVFKNQLRYDIPKFQPRRMDCMDIDSDGDLDVVVSAFEFNPFVLKSSLYVYRNSLNPAGTVASPMHVAAIDNVNIEVVAPNGARLNEVSNTLASASLYHRNLNGNSSLDDEVTSTTVSTGRYLLNVTPRPNLPSDQTFSLNYSLGGQTYQIARNLLVPSLKYVFPIFPDGQSGVTPLQGECTRIEHPIFEWDSAGGTTIERQSSHPFSDAPREFRIATDPGFESIVESATVNGHSYNLVTALNVQDTTSYYWQVRDPNRTEWGGIYVFHALPLSPTDVDDPGTGETDQNGKLPTEFALQQNYPNPFNPEAAISYSVASAVRVKLEVYNILGMLVTTLVDEYLPAGNYVATWDASEHASGIYLYRLTAGEFMATKKMILLK
ncbi:MAG: FG-GAP-like repeat-containing protein [candidate division Zixibacteria bacterium]|nr:FG-GAP-like repeat-containing protein [candidate division Zixibacteria bacterium]